MKWCGIIALLAILLIGIAGCEDTTNLTTEAPNNGHNGRVIGMVNGIVTAQGTNEPVADVRITYSINGDTRTIQSDRNGSYRIDGLDEGVYTICFFPSDTTYAAWFETVAVAYDSALVHPNDQDFHISIARNVMLYRCTATVTGYVYARVDDEHNIPAAGAVIQMSGLGGILNATYNTVCDSTGHYWLTGLPSVGTCMVMAMPWTSGAMYYGAGSQTVVLTPNGIIAANNMTLMPVTTPVNVLNNNFMAGDFPVSDNLVMVFSRPIKDSSLVVNMFSSTGFVPTTKTLDEAGITLTINPAVQLRPSTSYSVAVSGRTLDNLPFSYGPAGFTTEPRLELVETNLWQVDGTIRQDVGLNETLFFRFSRAIDINNPRNLARVLRGGTEILVDWGWSEDHMQLNITPVGSFLPATAYTAFFVACSPIFEDQVSMSIDFATAPDMEPPTQVTNVALDDDAEFDWMTNTVWLSWDTQPLAESFVVYAWDENHATDYISVGAFAAATFGRQRVQVLLPLNIDWLESDGIHTPFSGNNRVHLAVRAVNNAAAAPLSADVVAHDNVAPGGYFFSQDGTLNNTGNPESITVEMRFGVPIEYCADTEPTWGFEEDGGTSYLLPHNAATWLWDANHMNGTLTIIVPANRNGAGDILWMTAISDNSGNMQADTVFRSLF